jgi:hypothetical protein
VYEISIAATSGRTSGVVDGFEVLTALTRLFRDGFE